MGYPSVECVNSHQIVGFLKIFFPQRISDFSHFLDFSKTYFFYFQNIFGVDIPDTWIDQLSSNDGKANYPILQKIYK